MRALDLSSSSVAYRHLQKLEELGLLEKNRDGEYVIKEKASIRAHVWIGRTLVPRLIIYSLFFLGLLIIELATIIISFSLTQNIEIRLVYLSAITAAAMALFLIEGTILNSKGKPN